MGDESFYEILVRVMGVYPNKVEVVLGGETVVLRNGRGRGFKCIKGNGLEPLVYMRRRWKDGCQSGIFGFEAKRQGCEFQLIYNPGNLSMLLAPLTFVKILTYPLICSVPDSLTILLVKKIYAS